MPQQVLYQKSAKALDLLLQTFVAENKSMDEVCFLLQVKDPGLPGPPHAWSHTLTQVPGGLSALVRGWRWVSQKSPWPWGCRVAH